MLQKQKTLKNPVTHSLTKSSKKIDDNPSDSINNQEESMDYLMEAIPRSQSQVNKKPVIKNSNGGIMQPFNLSSNMEQGNRGTLMMMGSFDLFNQ